MTRFDATILPTVEEVRTYCLARADEVVGKCRLSRSCVLANMVSERAPGNMVAALGWSWIDGQHYLALLVPTGKDTWLTQNRIWLTKELRALALAFDCLDTSGTPITGAQVVPLCDRIIAERSAT